MPDEHFAMTQRRKLHDTINEIIRLDPDYTESHAFVKGWIVIADLSGLTSEDDSNAIEEVRGQPWADLGLYCSDATGEADLPTHSAEGLLRYVAAHYEEIYYNMTSSSSEDNDS